MSEIVVAPSLVWTVSGPVSEVASTEPSEPRTTTSVPSGTVTFRPAAQNPGRHQSQTCFTTRRSPLTEAVYVAWLDAARDVRSTSTPRATGGDRDVTVGDELDHWGRVVGRRAR